MKKILLIISAGILAEALYALSIINYGVIITVAITLFGIFAIVISVWISLDN